jgi:two-component system, OmpR family, KDP operon response regulator KdpE
MKALIIEDERKIIDAIKVAFEFRWPDAELIDSTTGKKGIDMVRAGAPDIVILDLNLPDISGYEVLKVVRQFSSVPVIILTVRSDDEDMLKGLEYGADDYITKPFNYMNLLARIRAVLRRTETIPFQGGHDKTVNPRLTIDFVNQRVKADNRPVTLTPIEYHLLALLVRNKDQIVTYARIMDEVWGKDYEDNNENIRIMVRRLREKLGDAPPNLIINQRGAGYMFKS